MSSDSLQVDASNRSGTVRTLLDLLFGFLVWAVHFLVVYCVNALACARGIGDATALAQSGLRSFFVFATLIGLASVGLHAAHLWRRRGSENDFLARLGLGCNAVAAVAMMMQLLPLSLLHLCR